MDMKLLVSQSSINTKLAQYLLLIVRTLELNSLQFRSIVAAHIRNITKTVSQSKYLYSIPNCNCPNESDKLQQEKKEL